MKKKTSKAKSKSWINQALTLAKGATHRQMYAAIDAIERQIWDLEDLRDGLQSKLNDMEEK